MKIERLEIVNFMGIKSMKIEMPQLMAICGANGIGKTSILNAIRYGITGEKPDGDIIYHGCDMCSVTVTFLKEEVERLEIVRMEFLNKPGKWIINGKYSTQKATNQVIEDFIGISLDKVKITSSGDLIAAMKPQEFSSFILDYIPEKLKLADVLSLVPDSTASMMEICEALLPSENIELATLNDFDNILRATRKDLKASLSAKQAAYAEKPSVFTGRTREQIEEDLTKLNALENQKKLYESELKAYNIAAENVKKHEAMIANLKVEISKMSALTKPDPYEEKKITDEINDIVNSINNNTKAAAGATTALKQLKTTLDALSKPICPISPLITCHENKTVAIEEISESITATEDGLKALSDENAALIKKKTEKEAELTVHKNNSIMYDKKLLLMKQLNEAEKSRPDIPVKPVAPEVPEDVSAKKFQPNEALKNIIAYEEGVILAKQIEKIGLELSDYEKLIKAFAEKGPVRNSIISKYLSVFENICNERSQKIRPELSFKFINDNGVVVLMDNGKGTALPYESLSGGEKAYMIFIIMDMLNQLTGTNILILDELSVIDEKCLNALFDTVIANKEDYDHILLATVDHTDIKEAIAKKSIPVLDVNTGDISA